MAFLTVELENGSWDLELTEVETSIGRSHRAIIRIRQDPRISHIHCMLSRRPDGTYLRDHNSHNGTFVNGKWLADEEVLLKDGDRIRIGKTRLLFHDHDYEQHKLLAKIRHLLHLEAASAPTAHPVNQC